MDRNVRTAHRLMQHIGKGRDFVTWAREQGIWTGLSNEAKALYVMLFDSAIGWNGDRALSEKGHDAMAELFEEGYVMTTPEGFYRRMADLEVEDEVNVVAVYGWGLFQ